MVRAETLRTGEVSFATAFPRARVPAAHDGDQAPAERAHFARHPAAAPWTGILLHHAPRQRAETAVMRQVAEALGNTPAVCRSSYVDPRLAGAFRRARTIALALERAERLHGDEARAVLERATIKLLTDR